MPVVFVVAPSNTYVTGVTPVDVTVMVPLFIPGQAAAVGVAVAVMAAPEVTVLVIVPVHPLESVKVMVCDPAEILVNTPVVFVVTPSRIYVTGAMPFEVTVHVALLIPGQAAVVGLPLAISAGPAVTVAVAEPVQPFTAVKVMV